MHTGAATSVPLLRQQATQGFALSVPPCQDLWLILFVLSFFVLFASFVVSSFGSLVAAGAALGLSWFPISLLGCGAPPGKRRRAPAIVSLLRAADNQASRRCSGTEPWGDHKWPMRS